MSTMKDIATDPTAAYHRWMELGALLGQAGDARLFPAMEHISRSEEEAEAVDYFKCPHCKAESQTIDAHDVAHRVSTSDEPDFDTSEINFYYSGSNFQGFVYLCGQCAEPVSLPEGWTEV